MSTAPRPSRSPVLAWVLISLAAFVVLPILALFALGRDPVREIVGFWDSLFPPEAVTPQGRAIRDLYDIVFYVAVAIFLFVEGWIIVTILRYRRRPEDDELPPQTHGNNLVEALWTIIPTIIVVVLFVISWQTLNDIERVSGADEPKVRIEVVGLQWVWQARYTDELTADGQPINLQGLPDAPPVLHVPAGSKVEFTLVSNDVIHAFYVPEFLFKRDVVPGKVNVFEVDIDPAYAGRTLTGQCTEFCGLLHQDMRFDIRIDTADEYAAWLTEAKKPRPSPTPAPTPGPGESPPPSGEAVVLQISADLLQFSTNSLTAPADTPFKIEFRNDDQGQLHNVAIHEGSPTGPAVFQPEWFAGPETRTYDVPPLAAGTYGFVCSVHPTMTGTLTVQ